MERDTVFVPYRFISDDGYCAIDVTLADNAGDVSNGLAIARSAEQLIRYCAAFGHDGYTRGFSKQTSLIPYYASISL